MSAHDRETILRRIDDAMQQQGFNDRSLALTAGIYQDAIRDLRRGKTQMLRADRLRAIFAVLGLSDAQSPVVPVVGTVGENSRVYLLQGITLTSGFAEAAAMPKECDFVRLPPEDGHRDVMAIRVAGDSMEPFLPSGTIVYYSRLVEESMDSCLNKLCVIGLKDQRIWLKKLKKSSVYGRYTLSSYNNRDMDDMEIAWCAPVIFIKPA